MVGVLEAIIRPISRARIEGTGIAVEAAVRRDRLEYVTFMDGYDSGEPGAFGRITIKGNRIKCDAPFDDGAVRIDEETQRELFFFLGRGDHLGAYLLVLDCISFRIESLERSLSMNRNKAEQNLGVLDMMKQGINNGRVIEEPADVLRRIDNLSQMAIV